ncbi:MAG: cytochrome c oxidase subunit II [Gammaproteobacteria bacterium]
MMTSFVGRCVKRTVGLLVAAGVSLPALAAWELNFQESVTDVGQDIFELHMLIFWVCVWIGVVVFGVMLYSIVKHRKSVHPEPAKFEHSTIAEIGWTTVPIIILVAMAFPAARVLVELEDNSNADLTVEVTGYQWNWHYKYPQDGVQFYSKLDEASSVARRGSNNVDVFTVDNYLLGVDKPMVVPVNKKVVLKLTANDVIHAWWVPKLGGKRDAIPGFINTLWFKAKEIGTYRGQCSELCGRDHGFMPIVVNVVSDADYAKWVAENQDGSMQRTMASNATGAVSAPSVVSTTAAMEPVVQEVPSREVASVTDVATAVVAAAAAPVAAAMDKDALMAAGETVYQVNCLVCHQATGAGMPPTFPALTGSAVATGPAEAHIDIVLNGRPGTAMLAFGGQLSDEDIAALVTYERNALGNSVGDVVTAADVAALRGE